MSVKDSILMAGVELLRERGVAALTQPQIARAAGIKQSHLTYYFPTRAKLMLGLAEHVVAAAIDDISARLAEKTVERSTLAAHLSEIVIGGLPPRVIIGLIVAADAEPEIRESLRELVARVRAQIQRLLAVAGLAASADAALLFHAVLVGLATMHQARMNDESMREVNDGLAAMLHLLALPVHDIQSDNPSEATA